MVLFEEIDKNIQFNSLFLGIRETSVSVLVRQMRLFLHFHPFYQTNLLLLYKSGQNLLCELCKGFFIATSILSPKNSKLCI